MCWKLRLAKCKHFPKFNLERETPNVCTGRLQVDNVIPTKQTQYTMWDRGTVCVDVGWKVWVCAGRPWPPKECPPRPNGNNTSSPRATVQLPCAATEPWPWRHNNNSLADIKPSRDHRYRYKTRSTFIHRGIGWPNSVLKSCSFFFTV